jgi:ankyrin repeat protein
MAGPFFHRTNGLHWPQAEWFQEWERLALHQPLRAQPPAPPALESPFELAPESPGAQALDAERPPPPEVGVDVHDAAARGDAAQVRVLLDADPERLAGKDERGLTPLHAAAGKGRKEVVELLLAGGADANGRDDNGWTPLHWAAIYGHPEVAALLLANHADTNARENNGWTPLHWAVGKGHKEVADLLRQSGGRE